MPIKITRVSTGSVPSDWLDDLITSTSQHQTIRDMLDTIKGVSSANSVDSVVSKYRDMVGLDIVKNASHALKAISPMKLKKLNLLDDVLEKFNKDDLIIQQKYDGFKTMAVNSNGDIKLFTRRGEEFQKNVPYLVKELESKLKPGDFILGEVTYIKDGKQSISDIQTIVNSSPEKSQKKDSRGVIFYVYDLLWNDGKDISKFKTLERYNLLKSKIGNGSSHIKLSPNYTWKQVDRAIKDALTSGGEGIVIKPKSSKYIYGKKGASEKTGDWYKFKPGEKAKETDVILNKYTRGKDKLKFPMYKNKGGKLKEVGTISGMSKEEEKSLKQDIDNGKSIVVQVSYQEETEDGKLRHAGWIRRRPDKPQKEVKASDLNGGKMKRYISKRASQENRVILLIEENPKLMSDIHSMCQHSGGHRDTMSILNFLRDTLGKDEVSFSDDSLKEYIEGIKNKYKEELNEQNLDIGMVGLESGKDDDKVADYIEHGKGHV